MEQKSSKPELVSLQEDLAKVKLSYADSDSEHLPENHQKPIQESKESELEKVQSDSDLETKEEENAMHNILVIECILKYLNTHDLKICRAVNWTWYLIGTPFLRKRVKISFDERGLFDPVLFIESSKDFLTDAPFDSFLFEGYYSDFRSIQDFFENYGKNVKKLTFCTSRCETSSVDEIFAPSFGSFNITPWIDPSNLTKLHLWNYNIDRKLEFSLTGLYSLEDFCAMHYKINIENLIRIAPTKVDLLGSDFYRGKRLVEQFHLNDLFDFRKAKFISLRNSSGYYTAVTKLSLDLAFEKVNADRVSLDSLDLQNFERCTWTVDTLLWSEMDFKSRTTMKIKNVYFELFDHSLDLYCLPATIESFELNACHGPIVCSKPITLSNVKYLCYCPDGQDIESILAFLLPKCDKLTQCCLYGPGMLPIQDLSSTLAVLKLYSNVIPIWTNEIVAGNEKKFHLQKLILQEYTMSLIKHVTSIIKCKELVLALDHDPDPSEEVLQFVLDNNNEDSIKKIVCGTHHYRTYQFKFNISLEFVDKRAGFYSFENKCGSEITHEQFKVFKYLEHE